MDVRLHQGSALSLHLFLILVGVITEWVRKEVPEYIQFPDDIPICAVKSVDMTEYLDTRRRERERERERERGLDEVSCLKTNGIR